MKEATVLIIEDGDEYLENLQRFVSGPVYLQAHDAAAALALLATEPVSLIYLDMRFDRIPRARLVGDHEAMVQDLNGDAGRAWRFLENNQGLFILAAIASAGHGGLPVILAYDFSREQQRWAYLHQAYPRLAWVPDGVSAAQIHALMAELLA